MRLARMRGNWHTCQMLLQLAADVEHACCIGCVSTAERAELAETAMATLSARHDANSLLSDVADGTERRLELHLDSHLARSTPAIKKKPHTC